MKSQEQELAESRAELFRQIDDLHARAKRNLERGRRWLWVQGVLIAIAFINLCIALYFGWAALVDP